MLLYWIQSGKENKQFVQNCVNNTLKLTDGKGWDHCHGTENPADVASRGLSGIGVGRRRAVVARAVLAKRPRLPEEDRRFRST